MTATVSVTMPPPVRSPQTWSAATAAELTARYFHMVDSLNAGDWRTCYLMKDPPMRLAADRLAQLEAAQTPVVEPDPPLGLRPYPCEPPTEAERWFLYHHDAAGLRRFMDHYGRVNVWHHELYGPWPEPQRPGHELAFVYAAWFDRDKRFHFARERWVRHPDGTWYTRVAGLTVPSVSRER